MDRILKISPVFITIKKYLDKKDIASLLMLSKEYKKIIMKYYCIKSLDFVNTTIITLQLIYSNKLIFFNKCDCKYNHDPCIFSYRKKNQLDISNCKKCNRTHIAPKNKFIKCLCGFKCTNLDNFTQCPECNAIKCNYCLTKCDCENYLNF